MYDPLLDTLFYFQNIGNRLPVLTHCLKILIPCLLFVISGCQQKENRPNVMLFCKRQPN